MQISKQQLQEMLQSPQFAGQDPHQVVKSIISQGNTIEGLDVSQQELSQPSSPTQPTTQNKAPGLIQNIESLTNPLAVGTGIVKGAAETFTGLANLASKGAAAIGIPQAPSQPLQATTQWANKTSNWGQGLGKGAEMVGELTTGEEALGGLAKLPTSTAGKLATKAAIGGGLFGAQEAAKTGDLTKAPGAALLGAVVPVGGAVISGAAKSVMGSLAENVGKALGFTGKVNLGQITEKIPQAVRALSTIADNAEKIVVKDLDGVEKTFEPAKATFGETLQALKSTKESIYKQYTDLAAKAGDTGAKFTQQDFSTVTGKLNDIIKNRTSPYAAKANQILGDITRLFPKGEADLPKIQSLIEDINKDVNPLSDKASAEVSSQVSSALREIMDNKITSSTGEGYQALRSQYSDLKSIENDLINKWKRSVRGTGSGVANWVEGFGTLDTAVSLLTGNISEGIRGVGMGILGKAMKYLRDPEVNLQRAFDMIKKQGESKPTTGIGKFLFDNTPASDTERKAMQQTIKQGAGDIKASIPQAGMSIKDISKIDGKSIPNILSRMDKEDGTLMTDFIDSIRLKKGQDVDLEIKARKIAEAMGINPDVSNAKLANKFDQIMSYNFPAKPPTT